VKSILDKLTTIRYIVYVCNVYVYNNYIPDLILQNT